MASDTPADAAPRQTASPPRPEAWRPDGPSATSSRRPRRRPAAEQQADVLAAFARSALGTRRGRAAARLAGLGALLRPARFTADSLQPWQQLEPEADGGWRATGPRPQFLASGPLPAGWLRVRLRMSGDAVGRLALHVLGPDGAPAAELLEGAELVGVLERELYVRLPAPAIGLRFDPLDRPGNFQLDTFEVRHVPTAAAAARALAGKLRLLSAHRIVGRTLVNGLRLLLRGRVRDFWRKLHLGLSREGPLGSDARLNELRLAPELVPAGSAIAGSGRCGLGAVPACPAVTTRPLWVTGALTGVTGYDNVTFEVVRGLRGLGVDVRWNARSPLDRTVVPRYFRHLVCQRPDDALELIVAPPHLMPLHRSGPNSVVLTMWESDRLDPDWVGRLNRARLVVVPSRWGVDSFRASGVTAPLVRVPLGHDPLVFHPDDNYPRRCVFGTAAALPEGGVRKNVAQVIELFREAFPTADVALKVKLTPDCPAIDPLDPRVEVVRTRMSPLALARWYRSLTAFLNASSGEGFGLHLIEAMACGRPVIGTAYGAVADYLDERVGYPVAHRSTPARGGRYTGTWGEPDRDQFLERMREAAHDLRGARARGRRAAARARTFTWKRTVHGLFHALQAEGVL